MTESWVDWARQHERGLVGRDRVNPYSGGVVVRFTWTSVREAKPKEGSKGKE